MTKQSTALHLTGFASILCLASTALAQTIWWKTYGGVGADMGYSVERAALGGYIVAGWTSFGGHAYLVATDAQGETLWTRTYGGRWGAQCYSVQPTTDGGYVLAGHATDVAGIDVFDYTYLVKTDASGETLWTRTYVDGSAGRSVQQTSDGGYIVAGSMANDVYLIKTDSSGDTIWTRRCGGPDQDRGNSVQQTTDGGYIVAGLTHSFGAGGGDVYLIRFDATGDTIWTRTIGGGALDVANSIRQTVDGGYVVTGYTGSFDQGGAMCLVRTDAQGDVLWVETYGTADEGNSVQQTADGGFIIAGGSHLIKTNSEGYALWSRTFVEFAGNSVQQTTDGGYVIAGSSEDPTGDCDVCLIKTDADGSPGSEAPLARNVYGTRLTLQPNPCVSHARIVGHETELFALADVTGRQVAVCRGDRIGVGLRPGVYLVLPADPKTSKVEATTIVKTAY